MGLTLCKKTQQMLPLVAAEFAYFSEISHLFQPSIYFTVCLHSHLCFVLSSFATCSSIPFHHSTFASYFSFFPSSSSFFFPLPSPSNPHCLLFSSPLLFTLFTLFFSLSLAFQEAQRVFSDWMTQGNVLLDCQVPFLKIKPAMALPALPRCGVNFKAMGFNTASASLRRDPLF